MDSTAPPETPGVWCKTWSLTNTGFKIIETYATSRVSILAIAAKMKNIFL